MANVQFIAKSGNRKVGAIPTTNSARTTCPSACPMIGTTACYAEGGYYTRMNWDKVDNGDRGVSFTDFISSVKGIKDGQLWRHNVSGDLQGKNNRIDGDALSSLVAANKGSRGFTYTHYPVNTGAPRETLQHNVLELAAANREGFTVNISANNPREAVLLRNKFNLPTVTLVPEGFWKGNDKVGDIVRCPAEEREAVTCASCKLCAVSDRNVIVGFTVHGAGKKKADVIARG